ncbi:MAG TPA: UDP-N-acetylglucosamine 2-epimerase (non-hydrolyzing) [Armatimonadota bacterium]|jgi:UDP-N-acetylglucosamine 2-epimerase (non-hydrolysing)
MPLTEPALSRRQRVLFIFGTRPEAIKLCPIVLHMQTRPDEFDVKVCVTAQHREMLDQVLAVFQVQPDHDLNVMRPNQTLSQSTARIIAALEPVLLEEKPDLVIVQGDTTTTFCGALAAFYQRIAVGHVEAGLRTGDLWQPFPEELNRVLTTRLTKLHFAPTSASAANLRADGVDDAAIFITGNSGIDAVLYVRDKLQAGGLAGFQGVALEPGRKLIVVTAHRRENFGDGLTRLYRAIGQLATRPDVQIIYPVHPNPNVRQPAEALLVGLPNVHLIAPLDYVPFVDLMQRAYLLLTDSGGVQEEAPSLGKPVLVLREKTERPEAVETGTVRLVGTDGEKILAEAGALLDDAAQYQRMSMMHNPYGDGQASRRIADVIANGEFLD